MKSDFYPFAAIWYSDVDGASFKGGYKAAVTQGNLWGICEWHKRMEPVVIQVHDAWGSWVNNSFVGQIKGGKHVIVDGFFIRLTNQCDFHVISLNFNENDTLVHYVHCDETLAHRYISVINT